MALTRNRLLLAKAESTYGTSSAPSGSDALLVSNLEVNPLELNRLDRELVRSQLGQTGMIVGQRMASVSFDVELAGSGAAGTAPAWGPVMKACGFAETIVASISVAYSPVSTAFPSVTLDFNHDGSKHLITGARGTWSLSLNTNEIPKISFKMMGIYNPPTATAQSTPTFSNQAAPVVVNSANTTPVSVHSYAACLESFSLELANETPFRQLAGCSQQVMITNRLPTGELVIEAPPLGTKDYFAIASAQTTGAISWTHGQTAGNIVAFSAATCSFDSPAYGDSDGIATLTLPFIPIAATANSDFTLTLT